MTKVNLAQPNRNPNHRELASFIIKSIPLHLEQFEIRAYII
uniref:Uncharacterized protein n=1 Tax=Rhizophora mucronata TaxID=61149 RepID=A0A2P2QHA7_RHIMU